MEKVIKEDSEWLWLQYQYPRRLAQLAAQEDLKRELTEDELSDITIELDEKLWHVALDTVRELTSLAQSKKNRKFKMRVSSRNIQVVAGIPGKNS